MPNEWINRVVEILRTMYRVQAEADLAGDREVACWYYKEDLENALGVPLWDDPDA